MRAACVPAKRARGLCRLACTGPQLAEDPMYPPHAPWPPEAQIHMQTSSTNSTIYGPLASNQIRLIQLQSAETQDMLVMKMVHSHLVWSSGSWIGTTGRKRTAKVADAYEATSYTWGDPTPTKKIVCNGQEIEIRENAFDFLQRLRLYDKERVLWMDCLCINQDDDEEKAHQVEQMHWIYRNAQAVLICLGQEDRDSALAMEYILTLDTTACVKEHLLARGNQYLYRTKSFLFDFVVESPDNLRLATSLFNITQRPWVRRVWIQQEAAVCEKTYVMCGQHEVSWDHFFSLIWLLTKGTSEGWPAWVGIDYRDLETGFDAMGSLQRTRNYQLKITKGQASFGTGRGPDYLQTVIGDCSSCKATDPRDKVYALYNISADCGPYALSGAQGVRPKIDYSVPWQIVYVRVARWMYETMQSNTIVMAGRNGHQSNADLPSWVPDWRHPVSIPFVLHQEWAAGGTARPSRPRFLSLSHSEKSLPAYLYKDRKGRTKRIPGLGMELNAIMLGRIAYKSLCLSTDSNYLIDNATQIRHIVQADLNFCAEIVPKYCTGETYEEAYAMTIIAAIDHKDDLATPEYATNGLREWRAWLEDGYPDPWPSYNTAIDGASPFNDTPFGVTAHGMMALVPQMCKVGDYIAVFEGFKHPCVLRRVGAWGGNYFELLDQCFVHGMMVGRVWNLIGEFRSKYIPGSEDEVSKAVKRHLYTSTGEVEDRPCEDAPFNPKGDYLNVRRVLGTRKVVLV